MLEDLQFWLNGGDAVPGYQNLTEELVDCFGNCIRF
jgi:hypothetical protein